MALPVWQATIVNEFGDIIPSATMTIVVESTGLPAVLWQDRNGTIPLGTNGVFNANTSGFAQFFAEPDNYRVKAEQASSGFSQTWDFVVLSGDAALRDTGTGSDQVPLNSNLGSAAKKDTGTALDEVPTNESLSTSLCGAATFSSDVYTFTPVGTGFRPLQSGMYLSFKLPSGSSNTVTTPEINYNGSNYTIKWIDGGALAVGDLTEGYNKQQILFYFDGTDMLISSDISGSKSSGRWEKRANGRALATMYLPAFTPSTDAGVSINLPITFIGTNNAASISFYETTNSNAAQFTEYVVGASNASYRIMTTRTDTYTIPVNVSVEGYWY